MEALNDEFRRKILNEGHFIGTVYRFTLKPNFSSLGSIRETSRQEPLISFLPDDNIRDLLEFSASIIQEEYKLSPNPVDILPFDNIFCETDIAQELIFKGKRSGLVHNFAMDVDPGWKHIEKFRGGVYWYKMHCKVFVPNTSFKFKR